MKTTKLWLVFTNQLCFTVLATGAWEAKRKFAEECRMTYRGQSWLFTAFEIRHFYRHQPTGQPIWWSVEFVGGDRTDLMEWREAIAGKKLELVPVEE